MVVNKKYPKSAETSKIISSAIEVHKALGNGFQEVIYQRALEFEMSQRDISFCREYEMEIIYKGEYVGTRRVDFLVEDNIMVELKAIKALEDIHLAQAINYLECYNLQIGLLINFGAPKIDVKRIVNKKYNAKTS